MAQGMSIPRNYLVDEPNYAPALPIYQHPLGETLAGRTLPRKITDTIFALDLICDVDLVALPHSMPLVGVYQTSATSQPEHIYLASRCALQCTCRALRHLYYQMFLNKVLNFDIQSLHVLVQDFNFGPFVNSLV